MSEELKLYQLLKIVKFEKNLRSLTRIGLSYKNIAEFAESAAHNGMIALSEESISLTEIGEKKYLELKEVTKNIKKDQWIDPEAESKTKPLDIDFIYLPDKTVRVI